MLKPVSAGRGVDAPGGQWAAMVSSGTDIPLSPTKLHPPCPFSLALPTYSELTSTNTQIIRRAWHWTLVVSQRVRVFPAAGQPWRSAECHVGDRILFLFCMNSIHFHTIDPLYCARRRSL
uniref:Uncharacterized protein n=1 Tax=Eutreptiella gymnastica TaxID=73025 RepID=A0A7S4FTM2_9EUGL